MDGMTVLSISALLVILGTDVGFLPGSALSIDDLDDLNNADDVQIVFPEQLHHRARRDTLAEHTNSYNKEAARFRVKAFGRSLTLDVIRNDVLVSEDFFVRSFNQEGKQIIKKSAGKRCQYQGHIEGRPESSVVLDTCDGISGIIEDESETFSITPFKAKGFNAHKIKRTRGPKTSDALQDFSCGTSSGNSTNAEKRFGDRHRRSLAIDPMFRSHIPVNKTRYAELIIIVDKTIYDKYGRNTSDVRRRIFDLVNAVDMIYQQINIRIILKALEIWTHKDLVKFNKHAGKDLNNLQKYRKKHADKYKCDVLHLLRGREWKDHGGMAYMREMCTIRSTGVVGWNKYSVIGPWIALAHEMGHNFGFDHDDLKKCKCLTPRGCIMRTFKTRIAGFSDCNLRDLRKIDDGCLYNIPVKSVNPRCGNGIKEGAEECDCGTKENCAIMDPCCNPKTCRLHSWSQCSDQHDKCCKNCQYAPTGSVCRKAEGRCDVPEFCTGKSGQCPPDDYQPDGTGCHFNDLELIANEDHHGIKKSRLPGRIRARFIRINPQHWHKHICMRTEIYGCDRVPNSNTPTSLRSDNNLYVDADNGICDPNDVSELVFKPLDQGTKNNMQFRLTKKGTLIHHCTGNMVCPKDIPGTYGTKLVVSKRCTEQLAKFRRIGNSLKHVESGFCIHPYGGLAQDGTSLVLWRGCKGKRNIALTFVKPDCETALGMESGDIPNDRIKATSFRSNREALHARLNGFNAWCAGQTDNTQYLQIDLGKMKFISAIATEGRYDGTRVKGYTLYYSTNGQRWTAYTGRRSIQTNNSYCFRGKCSATHNRQCRDVWSATAFSASEACYDKFNTENTGYGTCHPARIQPCLPQDAMCGQLQCSDKTKQKPVVSYGVFYKKRFLAGKKKRCSLVSRNRRRSDDLGMVKDGTKCGEHKICVNYKCRLISSSQSCPLINGKECAGNGFCTALGKCHCKDGFEPLTNCSTATSVVNGGWGSWSSWSKCSRICDDGTQRRHRFCNHPVPSLRGVNCPGERIQTRHCNLASCPVANSCRHLQAIGRQRGIQYPSGVYTINPAGLGSVKTYCDMTRNGGGWTLLITSHTNTWTPSNVRRRAVNYPALDQDFSILFAADAIKNSIRVAGGSFEYRIEAQQFGRWGGIWKAPRSYSFTAKNNKQTQVKLIERFDQWRYEDLGIEKRMPWIHEATLTTSNNATDPTYAYGAITSNMKKYYPAPWIFAEDSEKHPVNIWYWMREGEIQEPKSCMELQLMGLQSTPLSSGIYSLKIRGKDFKTYCDFTAEGGGWTLLVTSTSRTGWTRKTLRKRNKKRPSLNRDFSILGFSDDIIGQRHFQYKIEDDTSNWGGIFEAQRGQSFLSGLSTQTQVKILKKYGNWDDKHHLGQRLPYTRDARLLLTTAGPSGGVTGTIVASRNDAIYLPYKMERPSGLRLWIREGTWRSCNQIKQNKKLSGKQSSLDDGPYMIKNTSYQYLPVMCDMKSDKGAWTLLVTSAKNGWQKNQVKHRNTKFPSLSRDYSVLELGDQIKELSGGNTFLYKLEANQRGRWGGVWKAPKSYSFVATNNRQTHVTLVKKYDDWQYNWASSLEKRMPWLGKRKGLLTTSTHSDYSEWGSIVSDQTKNNPAPWIDLMINPGIIWYWVNEDDCGPNRKPVDGGLSSWSAWSACSPLCNANGIQTRHRFCSNPAPRCGGRSCDPIGLNPEKRRCRYCPKSPIKGPRNFCIQPSTANCNPPENTRLVYKKNRKNCDQNYMNFLYDNDGMLMHLCSRKYVCPQGGQAGYGTPLVLSNYCKQSHSRFVITKVKGLRHKKSGKCVHPDMGSPAEGVHLVTWAGCHASKLKLDLFKLKDANLFTSPLTSPTRKAPTSRAHLYTTSPSTSPTTAPTDSSPIRSHGGFCLQPRTADCSPADGTEIVYSGAGGINVQCSQNYMRFTLTNNGRLIHSCSGKYLCPDPDYLDIGGLLYNGIPVVLRKQCYDSNTSYTRTSRKSLRHVPSGFCVHPASGTPTSGTKAVFWNRCDLNRLKLDFFKLRD